MYNEGNCMFLNFAKYLDKVRAGYNQAPSFLSWQILIMRSFSSRL